MKKIFLLFLAFLFTSCISSNRIMTTGKVNQPIPEADFLFYTILFTGSERTQGSEVIGFYSFQGEQVELVELKFFHLEFPMMNENGTLLAIDKKTNPGFAKSSPGHLVFIRDGIYTQCDTDSTFGSFFNVVGENVVISALDGINIINLADCSISKTLLKEDSYLGTFSISRKMDFMILSHNGRIQKIDFPENRFTNLEIEGVYPALSPDETKFAYLGYDGIYVVDINGENNQKVVEYLSPEVFSPGYFSWIGEPPKPKWSPDGKSIIYHKCNAPTNRACDSIGDYSIFIYNVETGMERKIIDNGLDPSWFPSFSSDTISQN